VGAEANLAGPKTAIRPALRPSAARFWLGGALHFTSGENGLFARVAHAYRMSGAKRFATDRSRRSICQFGLEADIQAKIPVFLIPKCTILAV